MVIWDHGISIQVSPGTGLIGSTRGRPGTCWEMAGRSPKKAVLCCVCTCDRLGGSWVTLGSSMTDVIDDGALVSPSSFSHQQPEEWREVASAGLLLYPVSFPWPPFSLAFAFLPGPPKASPFSNQ